MCIYSLSWNYFISCHWWKCHIDFQPFIILKSIGKNVKWISISLLLWDARKFEKLNNFKQSFAALVGGTFPYCFQQKWIWFAVCTFICIFWMNSLLLVEESRKNNNMHGTELICIWKHMSNSTFVLWWQFVMQKCVHLLFCGIFDVTPCRFRAK